MIIGEVKEGSTGDAQTTAHVLLQRPQVITACGHSVRLVVFGGSGASGDRLHGKHHCVSMRHIAQFLRMHVPRHRDVFRASAASIRSLRCWLCSVR